MKDRIRFYLLSILLVLLGLIGYSTTPGEISELGVTNGTATFNLGDPIDLVHKTLGAPIATVPFNQSPLKKAIYQFIEFNYNGDTGIIEEIYFSYFDTVTKDQNGYYGFTSSHPANELDSPWSAKVTKITTGRTITEIRDKFGVPRMTYADDTVFEYKTNKNYSLLVYFYTPDRKVTAVILRYPDEMLTKWVQER